MVQFWGRKICKFHFTRTEGSSFVVSPSFSFFFLLLKYGTCERKNDPSSEPCLAVLIVLTFMIFFHIFLACLKEPGLIRMQNTDRTIVF